MCTRTQLDAFERSSPPSHPRLDRRDHFLPSRFFSSYQYLSSVHSSKRRCLTGMTGRRKKEKKNGKKSRPIDLFPLLVDTIACSTSISHRKRFFFDPRDFESNEESSRKCKCREKGIAFCPNVSQCACRFAHPGISWRCTSIQRIKVADYPRVSRSRLEINYVAGQILSVNKLSR